MKNNIRKSFFLFGFLGFLGFKGLNDNPLYFLNFAFGGYFSYFWWSKLGHIADERLKSNKNKAGSIAFRICFAAVFLISIIIALSSLDLQASFNILLIIISLTFAIATNLWAFLTYKFCNSISVS